MYHAGLGQKVADFIAVYELMQRIIRCLCHKTVICLSLIRYAAQSLCNCLNIKETTMDEYIEEVLGLYEAEQDWLASLEAELDDAEEM